MGQIVEQLIFDRQHTTKMQTSGLRGVAMRAAPLRITRSVIKRPIVIQRGIVCAASAGGAADDPYQVQYHYNSMHPSTASFHSNHIY